MDHRSDGRRCLHQLGLSGFDAADLAVVDGELPLGAHGAPGVVAVSRDKGSASSVADSMSRWPSTVSSAKNASRSPELMASMRARTAGAVTISVDMLAPFGQLDRAAYSRTAMAGAAGMAKIRRKIGSSSPKP